jgi:hypothetical protein
VGIPHCEHIAAPLFLRSTVTVAPSIYKTGTVFSFIATKTGTTARKGVRIETYTKGVLCKAIAVENVNGKHM